MTASLSSRAATISPSETIAMNELAGRLRSGGRDVIDLTVGEPDFPTPAPVLEAAKRALDEGYTRYTAVAGLPGLREAICRKLASENGLHYTPRDIVVSCGAKQALFNAVMSLVDPGDEVIIPTPSWVSYVEMVRLAGGRPVLLPTEAATGYRLSPVALEAAIGPRTKALILCSPSNPSGAVYSADELAGLAAVLEGHPGTWVISDEVYERIDYSGKRASPAAIPALAPRCALVGGVSKSWAMTGFRIGWLAAPPALAAACTALQGQTTTSATAVAQRAAWVALESDPAIVSSMVAAYARRRALVLGRLSRLPALSCFPPEGAFYVFPDVSGLEAWRRAPAGSGSRAVASLFLERALVATVPGAAFGDDRSIRISFAAADDRLVEAFDRIEALLGPSAQGG
jgi:aspartate aminotransferase